MRPFYCFVLAIMIAVSVAGQPGPEPRERLESLIGYLDMKVPADTLSQWSQWVTTGEATTAANDARSAAWKKFLLSFYNHRGSIANASVSPQRLAMWAQYLTNPTFYGQIADVQKLKASVSTTSPVKVTGNGKTTLILIPPIGFSAAVFETFKATHAGDFRFIEVSYPGAGNTVPYAFPDKADYAQRKWLESIEMEISKTLRNEKTGEAFVVGLGSGMYLAMRLAIQLPSNIKGIVSVNGQFVSPMASANDANEEASSTERIEAASRAFPSPLLVRFSPALVTNNFSFTKDNVLDRKYLNDISAETVPHYFRYSDEFSAQDVTPQLSDFNTPILSLISNHDDLSPIQSNKSVHMFWQKLRFKKPGLNFSLVVIENSRSAIYIDQPRLFDIYFEAFIKDPKRKIESISTMPSTFVERASPAASVRQTIGTLDIEVQYSRPSLKGRAAFGKLVPYDQVWRAGANEATRITLTKDAFVNGQALPKGTYSFFIIPRDGKWTAIFNQLPDQWGAFTYNRKFDALRVEVAPENTAAPQETLKFDFDNLKDNSVDMSLYWENTKCTLTIEEHFHLPLPTARVLEKKWIALLADGQGDGRVPELPDGKSLSYVYDKKTDSLWFRFDLYKMPSNKAFALNVIIDEDNDQRTGMQWFGTNTKFSFDKAITLWMRKEGEGFGGVNGITDIGGVTEGNWNKLAMNNVTYYIDPERKLYIAGVKLSDLKLPGKTVRVLGAVGEYMNWNDDIGDNETALIKF